MKSLPLTYVFLFFLMVVAIPLRFVNLGYSEFQDDEKKALIKLLPGQTSWDFFMTQRKGPAQFVVTSITSLVTNGNLSEIPRRLPFTVINTLSVVVVFLLIKKYLENDLLAFFGAGLYAVNGFVVGFSRIAQYQNLNLLFSFLALYFYLSLIKDKNQVLLKSILGTVSLCLSVFAHWDAVFILVPVILIFVKYLRDPKITKKSKIILILANLAVGCLILLPFLLPYIASQQHNPANIDYFNKRVGSVDTPDLARHLMIFKLYNPFVLFEAILFLAVVSLIFIKKSWPILLWALINFGVIKFFMVKPGTHIYNYVLPFMFFALLGLAELTKSKIKPLKITVLVAGLALLVFLFFQSYTIFIHNRPEYPFREKTILGLKTTPYVDTEVLTFGFPHNRGWREISKIILNDPQKCNYVTNEGKEISQCYMPDNYGKPEKGKCYYIVVVKYPFITTRGEVSFAETKGKELVYKYERDGETLSKVYRLISK